MNLKKITFRVVPITIGLFVTPLFSRSQIYYSIPPMVGYLTFYKNGESFYVLNDSIKTNLYKFSDTSFLVKFYINDKLKKECYCASTGNTKREKVRFMVHDKKEHYLIYKQIIVRKLVWKDSTCIHFLPNNLLK